MNELFSKPVAWGVSKILGYDKSHSILTPLKKHEETIGALVMSSVELTDYA